MVAVIGVPDEQYGQRLAAYLALHDGATLDAAAVREHVRAHRARFCVPREVMFLDALPRNATGKIVTRELPEAGGPAGGRYSRGAGRPRTLRSRHGDP